MEKPKHEFCRVARELDDHSDVRFDDPNEPEPDISLVDANAMRASYLGLYPHLQKTPS